jgi:hypothetical protein
MQIKSLYQPTSETSKTSAAMRDKSGSTKAQADFIIDLLQEHKQCGLTVDELTTIMRRSGWDSLHNGTVAGCVVGLERLGRVIKSSFKRKTTSGRMATVYDAVNGGVIKLNIPDKHAELKAIAAEIKTLGTLEAHALSNRLSQAIAKLSKGWL